MSLRFTTVPILAALLVLPLGPRGVAQTAHTPEALLEQVVFDVPDIGGGRIRSAELAGKVVLLDLWATWCGPCEEALPFYASLQQRYGEQGLVVVALSVDDELGAVQRFVRTLPRALTVGWDEAQLVASTLQPTTLPTSWLIGRDGTTKHVHVGFRNADRAPIEQRVLAALAEPWSGALPAPAEGSGAGVAGAERGAGGAPTALSAQTP